MKCWYRWIKPRTIWCFIDSTTTNPRSKIIFSNGKETKKIRIASTKEVSTLTSDGLNNLNILLNYSDGTFSNSTIIEVPKGATDLYNTLKGAGRNVQYFDPNQPDFDFS
ncbi:hypothetical protein NWP96_04580 [Mycoplasmopsis cynos]|nr:hypothetical protein [Mycoplasmopsis cynos]